MTLYKVFENFPKELNHTFLAKTDTVEAMDPEKVYFNGVFNMRLSLIIKNKCFLG